jgi:hypothetical protein
MAANDLHKLQMELDALTNEKFQAGWKFAQERMKHSLDGVMMAADVTNACTCVAAVAAYRNIQVDMKTVDTRVERLKRKIEKEQAKLAVETDSERSS